MSVKSALDSLINAYETNGQVTAGRILRVPATPNTIRKFARKVRGGPFMYRGREIVPGLKPLKERPTPQQSEIVQ